MSWTRVEQRLVQLELSVCGSYLITVLNAFGVDNEIASK